MNTLNSDISMLGPVVALVLWSMVMWSWMYATRIPAIMALKMRMDSNRPRGEQMAELPPQVRWKADNYNHLMEQPTLFYAVTLALALMGDRSCIGLGLAWAYVATRVVHSFVQVLGNVIIRRFAVFSISSLILIAETVRAAALLLA